MTPRFSPTCPHGISVAKICGICTATRPTKPNVMDQIRSDAVTQIYRYHFSCVLCGQHIQTDTVLEATDWLDKHVADFKAHQIVLTDREHQGEPTIVSVDARDKQ